MCGTRPIAAPIVDGNGFSAINGNEVAITAEVKHLKDANSGETTVLRAERYYGKLERAFQREPQLFSRKRLGQKLERSTLHRRHEERQGQLDSP